MIGTMKTPRDSLCVYIYIYIYIEQVSCVVLSKDIFMYKNKMDVKKKSQRA